jgi:ribosomal-protein-alanine N-acetyltransferase
MTVLETERLTLRPLREGDLDELAALRADPELTRFLSGGQPRSREEMAKKLHRAVEHWRLHGFGMFAMLDGADGRFAGHCGVGYLHGLADAELAYSLARRFWNRGLASEAVRAVLRHAFEVVGLPRVVGVAVAENIPSQRVMAKAGMALQGPYEIDGRRAVLYAIENPSVGSRASTRVTGQATE